MTDINANESSRDATDERERQRALRRQLDEFYAENAHRIRPFDGAEHVGSVVAAAVGVAIVHVGRHEYVSVVLPEGSAPPDVGTSVAVDRAGNLAPQADERDARGYERSAFERRLS